MMRRLALSLLLATAACSPSNSDRAASNAVPDTTAPLPANQRGAEPKTSASAKEARDMVVRYFDLIKRGKYADARLMWGHDGADSRGSAQQFAALFHDYLIYEPAVGEPTDIHAADAQQYINVAANVHVKLRKNGKVLDLVGPVMLRRSANPTAAPPGERDWQIWGTDFRVPH